MTVLADSAYGSGQFRAELGSRGHTDRVKPAPSRPAVPGGFTVDDFTVDHDAGAATCPNRVTKKISPSGWATFGAACTDCPLRARCTRSRDGQALEIRPHDALQRAVRRSRHRPGLADRIPTTPADGRTHHRLAGPRQPARALPRRNQEQPLAAPPRRGAQPAPAPSISA